MKIIKIKLVVLVVILSIICHFSYAQTYYQYRLKHIGIEEFYNNALDIAAHDLSMQIEVPSGGIDFPVLSYNIYPVLGSVDHTVGIESTNAFINNDLASYPYYLAIIKTIEKNDIGINFIKYSLRIKFPNTSQFAEYNGLVTEAITNKLSRDLQLFFDLSGDVIGAEKNLMSSLLSVFSGMDEEDVLQEAGFTEIKLGPVSFSCQNGQALNIDPLGSTFDHNSRIINFAELGISENDQFSPYTQLFDQISANQFLDYLDIVYVQSATNKLPLLNESLKEYTRKISNEFNTHMIIWTHIREVEHDGVISQKFYIQSFIYASQNEIDMVFSGLMFDKFTKWNNDVWGDDYDISEEGPPVALRDDIGSGNREDKYKNLLLALIDSDNFLGGMGLGLLGGLLGQIKELYEIAKGTYEGVSGFFSKSAIYVSSMLVDFTLHTTVTYSLAKEDINEIFKTVKDAWNFVSSLNTEKLMSMVIAVGDGIKAWLGEVAQGTAASGYLVGKLMFNVVFTLLSGAAGAAAMDSKYATTFFKYLKEFDSSSMSGFVQKLMLGAEQKVTKAKMKICKILGSGCFIKDTPVLMVSNNPFKAPALAYSLAALPLVAPIQDVKPDDLVKAYHHEQSFYATADNSDKVFVSGWLDYDYLDITPETWQIGTFEIIEANGDKVEVEANRPKTWYANNNVNAIGDKAYFYMPEIGINGEANLLSIRPTVINTTNFALNKSGMVDRPVITTFKRNAPVVYDYYFSDGAVLGATPEHPFFSLDRNNYVAVGELQVGEQVMTTGQRVVKFIAGKQREKGELVYNFEVWREHNYYVGNKEMFNPSDSIQRIGEFLLVHNSCIDLILGKLKDSFRNFEKALGWADDAAEEIVEDYVSGPLKDIAVETGKEVTEAVAKSVRTSSKAFAKNILGDVLLEVAAAGFQVNGNQNPEQFSVSELHLEVTLKNGDVFVTIPDQAIIDLDGNIHLGEAKYTEVDKEWNPSTFRSASTDKQKKFIDAMESNNVASIKPLGPQQKLNGIGLTRHQVYTPEQIRIKSYHYMGSAKKSTTSIAKKIKKLF